MSLTTSIEFEHGKGNEPSNLDDGDLCEDTIEIELEYEPGESNYGADADGNRGISVSGYFYSDTEAPLKCEECGHIYSDEERADIQKEINKKCENYERDYDPPEPDYEEDLRNSLPRDYPEAY
jgi:hypothetical protein